MKHEPNPSDEEIRSYMNFDRLLEKRTASVHKSSVNSIIKWSILFISITGLVAWFLFPKETPQAVIVSTKIKEDSTVRSNPSQAQVVDSISDTTILSKMSKVEAPPSQPEQTKKSPAQQNTERSVKDEAYIQAEPLDGYPNLYDYFNSNLVYPPEALKDSIQGVQIISFIINAAGKPEKIEVAKSLGEPFEKEAKRLIETMPAWIPATLHGKPVASKISLPITFQIQKIQK